MDNKYFTIFDLMKDELDLDDKECTRVSGDPELAKWYSVIGLLNMSANELGEGEPSGEELESKLNDALTERYRDTDEMKKELDNALEILRKTIADNTIILGKYTSNYQIAIRALTDSNEAKDKIIEDREETIRRLKRERVERVFAPNEGKNEDTLKESGKDTSMDEKAEPAPKALMSLKDLLKREKEDPVREEQKDPEDTSKTSPDGEAVGVEDGKELGSFIDEYINNEEYSEEARSYLLSCYQSGTPLEVIRQFARPQFSVKIMKRLKRIYERRNL